MENKKNKKGIVIALVIFAVIVLALFGIYTSKKETGTTGSKNIEILVVDADGAKTEYKLSTDQEYLQGALDELAKAQRFSYKGVKQSVGFMIQEINGKRAVYEEDGSYWAIYVNDEYAQYGIVEQAVKNGDKYKFEIEKM